MDLSRIKQDWSDDELTIEYNDISLKKETEEPELTPITFKDLKSRLKDKLQNYSLKNKNVLYQRGNKYFVPKIVQHFSLATEPSDNKTKSKKAHSIDLKNSGLISSTPKIKPRDANKVQNVSLATEPSDLASDNKTKSKIAHSIDLKNSGLISSTPKVKPRNANKNILLNKHINNSKLPVNFSPRISLNKILKPSYVRPINTTSCPFDGVKFLRTQVHSNPFLQSLLKDIVSLNNKKDDEDEDDINREIAKLRSKNKLPSLNPEVSMEVEFDDSDYLEDSEDDSFSYCNSKSSENYGKASGKDSGYDNESQNSESHEEDTRSEINENGLEHALVAVEPEYVDLDNYFESNTNSNDKGKTADSNPVSKKIEGAVSDETISKINQNNEFACSDCNRIFKNKKSYTMHAKNHKTCFKAALSKGSKESSNLRTSTMAKQSLDHFSRKDNNTPKSKPAVLSCKECSLTFISQFVLEYHYEKYHSVKQYSNIKREKESSESDSVEIIELDSD